MISVGQSLTHRCTPKYLTNMTLDTCSIHDNPQIKHMIKSKSHITVLEELLNHEHRSTQFDFRFLI